MANYLFKFSTLGSAKFVVERLNQMGVKAAYMPSGYICVDNLTEAIKKLIKDSLGTHVAATEAKKQIKSELTKPTVKTNSKKPAGAPKISPQGQKMLSLQSMAYETLKRIVEKNPKGFPKLAKIMGFKVKS